MYPLTMHNSLRGLSVGAILLFCILRFFIGSSFGMALNNAKSDAHTTIKETSSILEQNPSNYDAYTRRGFAHYTLFEGDLALDDYSKAIAILPSAKLYKMRADCYDVMGHGDLAAQDRATAARF